MPKAKQLTVPCENRPGTLSQITRILGDARVNILAVQLTTAMRDGYVRLVVDNPKKAKKILDRAGLPYVEQSVLRVELPNLPGALRKFTQKLATRNINITACYQTTLKGSRKASVILQVSDPERASRIR